MGPQLYRCGNSERQSTAPQRVMLQWGRNFIVAETSTMALEATTTSLLQWGRNFIVAETGTLILGNTSFDCRLQWGRNFIVAETRHNPRSLRRLVIASMGPQLYRCGNLPPPTRSMYGIIRFNGAATLSLRKLAFSADVRRTFLASMGPQLYRCGNTPTSMRSLSTSTRFNGAATLSLRKPANWP